MVQIRDYADKLVDMLKDGKSLGVVKVHVNTWNRKRKREMAEEGRTPGFDPVKHVAEVIGYSSGNIGSPDIATTVYYGQSSGLMGLSTRKLWESTSLSGIQIYVARHPVDARPGRLEEKTGSIEDLEKIRGK